MAPGWCLDAPPYDNASYKFPYNRHSLVAGSLVGGSAISHFNHTYSSFCKPTKLRLVLLAPCLLACFASLVSVTSLEECVLLIILVNLMQLTVCQDWHACFPDMAIFRMKQSYILSLWPLRCEANVKLIAAHKVECSHLALFSFSHLPRALICVSNTFLPFLFRSIKLLMPGIGA